MGFFSKTVQYLKDHLSKTRSRIASSLAAVLPMGRRIDDALLDELEATLIGDDIGVETTERLIGEMARHHGPMYMRTSRPKTPVIYDNDEAFPIGGLKVLRQSPHDTATVIAAGVTLFEALEAHDVLKAEGVSIRVIDLYCIQPVDRQALVDAGLDTGRLITVEDHYLAGGIGDAVSRAVAEAGLTVTRLAVDEIPRSGKPDELIDKYGGIEALGGVQHIAISVPQDRWDELRATLDAAGVSDRKKARSQYGVKKS